MVETYDFQVAEANSSLHNRNTVALAFCVSGSAWAREGNLDRAITDFDTALTMEPSIPGAFVNRANAWARKGDLERAIADLDAELRFHPHDTMALKNRELIMRQERGANSDPGHN
ncbi:MAG: tetratricopeptide repeat protein [Betaproteobacteria bacterium]|nr:tetratricopeptide repeat protein [Betaproteobacteria bacterium]